MKRSLLLSLMLLCCFAGWAQTTYYYNPGNTSSISNSPFSNSNAKQQTLHPSGQFTGATAGYITSVWFKPYTNATNTTFTNLEIKLGQTTANSFTNGTYFTPMTSVLSVASFVIPTVTASTWVEFPLTTPFLYDNTKSLIIEVSNTAVANGFSVYHGSTTNRRISGTTGASSGALDPLLTDGAGITIVVPCVAPYNISKTNITTNSADIAWQYQYPNDSMYEYLIDQTVTDPPGMGYITTYNKYLNLTNLKPNTCYYVHLRTNCKMGSQSLISTAWALDSFCTLPECEMPPVVIDTAKITGTTAIVQWSAVPGAYQYEYTVSINNIPPVQGIFTPYTAVKLQGLTPHRPYFFMLRAYCQPVPTSSWEIIQFQTRIGTGIEEVQSGDFSVEAYPNPAGNSVSIYVLGQRHDNARIQITDMAGKVVRQVRIAAEETKVDLSDLSSGLYFIRYSDSERTEVTKLSKQ